MRRSLRSWLWGVPVDREVDEELAFHVEMRTRELIDRGMAPEAARAEAARRAGDLAALRRACIDLGRRRDREMRLTQWLEEFTGDVMFALRQLRSSPVFTCVATLTLALGIGANGAIFALVDATLLRPLPFRDPDRLVMMWDATRGTPRGEVSPLNMIDWNAQNRTFDLVAGFVPGVGGMVMRGADGLAETVSRQWVTSGFFDVLGVQPIVGRTFHVSDDRERANLIVLSEPFWRQRFGADPSIVGRPIELDGTAYTVVGVVPRDFQLLGRTSTWALMSLAGSPPPALRGIQFLHVVGRMAPAATLSSAEADINGVAAQLASVFPATNAGHGVALEPLRDALVGRDLQLTSFLLVGVVGFVLLICCANVANLLLGRGAARAREFAIRSSLGAGRRRLVRQLLTESLVLAALGGGLGAAVGAAILSAAPSLLPDDLLPAAVTLHFDARVLVFCAATALIVGLAFGLAPAWQTGTLASPLAQRTGTADRHGATVRRILVTGEVAAAVVVLFGAGLLLRTLVAVSTVDRGYRAQGVLTMLVDPLGSKYPTPASLLQFYGDIEREVAAVPGVRSVAWAGTLPMGYSEGGRYFFEVAGSPAPPADERPSADYQIVSPAYFDTIDLPILAGRAFTDHDTPDSVPVCIVNEAFARMYLRGRNPIGARVAVRSVARPQSPAVVREVVGIARQVKERPDETTDLVQIYVPMAQDTIDDIFLVLRPLSGRAADLAQSVRRAIGRVDKEQLVSVREVMTLEAIEREATGRHRFRAEFFVAFGALALVLAMVGVFGVLANAVQSRTREFGVRRVLGATSAEVIRPLVASAIRLVLVGTAIGLALALGFGRLLSAVLFGVQPLDPITFAGIALLLACTGVVSALAPAWRAARIDPAVALRSE